MYSDTMVAQTYAQSSMMTAGHLKSYQLLLEKAILLVRSARGGDHAARNRAQDIVAQVQSGLNLEYTSAQQLFIVLGYVWDALEWDENIYYDRAEDLLRQIREVVVYIQRTR
jgi:flagellin-specific chaperone FliS